ncbi:pantothenate kinase [Helicobacter pylori]|uniref:pantothenate kinase n=1 Tax=Helicobacter pylori TaxID=210 RepID=UPI000EB27E63|nr:pantothenate kinase [Helicobacter pylori]RKV13741.1 pantothenate kinase [Helicobacter pylori]WQX61414.1 pantothenate kinase [Helicobacter pylori]
MSGLRTFSCVVVLCGAMANVAIAGPKIETRGELGKLIGGAVGNFVGDKMGGFVGGAIGGYIGSEVGDRVEDYIRGVDREPQTREPQTREPQTREPQTPREPIRDFYDYGYSFGHAW